MRKQQWIMFILVFVCIAAIALWFLNPMHRKFAGYDDEAALAAASPKSHYSATEFVGNHQSDQLLSIGSIRLIGVLSVFDARAEQAQNAQLQCSFSSLNGAFKLILVTEDGSITTLFDSAVHKSGDAVTVALAEGDNSIRLVGKPAQLKDFLAVWTQIDPSQLT